MMNPGGLPPVLLHKNVLKLVLDLGEVAHRAAVSEPGEQLGPAFRAAPGLSDGQYRGPRPQGEEQDNAGQADCADHRPDVRGYIPKRHSTRIGPSRLAVNLTTTGAEQSFSGSRPAVITQPGR